jgi:L-alanine-DL-glutamate epimerase-like enolase superfamily enzyme
VTRRLSVRAETWPLARRFVIARGARTEARVVVCEITDGDHLGRGESVPYPRYDETVDGVIAEIENLRAAVEGGCDRAKLQILLHPGAARNALDCALWDLEAKQAGVRAWTLAGREAPHLVVTAFTLSLDEPDRMADAARRAANRPLLKLKLGGAHDIDRVRAVRVAALGARLIVDANESLSFDDLKRISPELKSLGVALIEQPLPAAEDSALEGWSSPVPLCADESLHTRAELDACARRYSAINIKLDKTGGLTEALALADAARAKNLKLMIGCMVGTSLAMAPALLLTNDAEIVDLDGPLWMAKDRDPGLVFHGSTIEPPPPNLWG